MIIYIGEFIGTTIFILAGLLISSNIYSLKGESKLLKLFLTSLGWALAYLIPSLAFGEVSGPHLNPALSIALTFVNLFEKRFVIGYIISQTAGALLACIIFYICNFSKINAESDEDKLKMFTVAPDSKNVVVNFIREFVATFLLVFGLLGITQVYGIRTEIIYIFYVAVFMLVGLAFDFTTVATNPIRDLIPRIFYAIMPIEGKGKVRFFYFIITIIATVLGAILAAKLMYTLPWDTKISYS